MKIKIGLYKHKETGQFDVMIDEINNTFNLHNGEFDRVEQFEYYEETEEDKLRKECEHLLDTVKYHYEDYLKPVLQQGKTADFLDDKKINAIRENLYELMCKRRKLMKVNEYEYKGDN